MDTWGLLGLDMAEHRAVALVGAGGKSSTMYSLARQARDTGRTVIVTTTTHIMPHPRLPLTDDPDPERLRALLARHGVITLGRFLRPDKLSEAGSVAVCRAVAGVVIAEADGARLRPLKAPAEHEPVIPPAADAVVAVAGLDSVGAPIGAVCHRPERVCALLGKSMEAPVTAQDVALLLAHPLGGRKGLGERMAFRCLLNKADTPQRAAWGAEICRLLGERGVRAAVTHYTEKERGGACWF